MIPLFLTLALQVAPSVSKPAPSTVAFAKKAEDPYETVCRREQRTGSRITTPVCHTRDEWALMEKGSKEFMDRALHPTGCAPGSTC